MDIVFIADMHGHLDKDELREVIGNKSPDIMFLLGDNFPNDLYKILQEVYEDNPCDGLDNISIYSVLGNHDDYELLCDDDFKDKIKLLDKKIVDFKGITIGGLSGSVKYKPRGRYVMLTQEESVKALDNMCPVDIFLTHDKPLFKKPKMKEYSDAHEGLYGIGKYIMEKSPKYVFHGHLHKSYKDKYKNTVIQGIYGIERIEIEI